MALVEAGWEASFDLMDGGGKIGVKTVRLRAADAAEAETAAAAYLASLVAVTDCILVGYRISQIFTENAIGALPAVTVRLTDTASVTAAILDLPFKFATVAWPGPKITVFNGTSGRNSNIVNVGAAIVTAFLTEYTEAGSAYISDGESLDPVFNASGERVSKYRRLGNN
jgi:hypothetical protein